jgi:hypothetical protein
MHEVGFEPTIQVFRRMKTFHTLDLAATVIGLRDGSKVKTIICFFTFVDYN